jgi:short-subunit dehydrogenase
VHRALSIALITGGSKGIGYALADELAKRGFDLLLIARSEAELKTACGTLSGKYNIQAHSLALDLSEADAPDKILEHLKGNNLSVTVLINNAGYALWGSFAELPFADQQKMLTVNVVNLMKLTHLLLPELRKQKKSYILNVSSTTAYQPVAWLNVYAASKAFVISFSRALRTELKNSSISVSVLVPGTTTSNFMDRAGMNSERIRSSASKVTMTPASVAAYAIPAMFRGVNEIVPGFINWLSSFLIPFLPKQLPEKIAAKIYKK